MTTRPLTGPQSTAEASAERHARYVLRRLGLPRLLGWHLRKGTLLAAIEAAERAYDQLAQALDEWEVANQAAAELVPWRDAREAWKAAGRPRPPWYELLAAFEDDNAPIRRKHITARLYSYGVRGYERASLAKRRCS